MTINLLLTQLRDVLTNWDHTPELNMARAHEARQIYAERDRLMPKRIVPISFARLLQTADPTGSVFFIQYKSLPADIKLDQWTPTFEYGVVWSSNDWPNSHEYRWYASESYKARRQEYESKMREEDRLTRMARTVTKHLGPSIRGLPEILKGQESEASIRSIIEAFENVLGIKIYETPENTQQS